MSNSNLLNKVILGNSLEIMKQVDDSSIELILTDPPYDRESLFLIEALLKESERILTETGNLIFLCGHDQLFYILDIKTNLRKWWICWLNHNRSNRIFGKNVIVKGKPVLWYNNKKRAKTSKVPMDTITLPKEIWSKKFHKWEQPIEFFEHYIEFLTTEKDIVFDPFLGSGSCILAAKRLNRQFIGIEKEEKYFNIAENRLSNQTQ